MQTVTADMKLKDACSLEATLVDAATTRLWSTELYIMPWAAQTSE